MEDLSQHDEEESVKLNALPIHKGSGCLLTSDLCFLHLIVWKMDWTG